MKSLKLKKLLLIETRESKNIKVLGVNFKVITDFKDYNIKLNFMVASSKDFDKVWSMKDQFQEEITKKLKMTYDFEYMGYGGNYGAGFAYVFNFKPYIDNTIKDLLNKLN